jgi:hypothetical protein
VELDVTYFLLALEQVGDFDVRALAIVEAAWRTSTCSMFGWVFALMSGQRFYLEVEVADIESERVADVEMTRLAAQQRYPDELETCAWYRPNDINRHLGLAGPFVH